MTCYRKIFKYIKMKGKMSKAAKEKSHVIYRRNHKRTMPDYLTKMF